MKDWHYRVLTFSINDEKKQDFLVGEYVLNLWKKE